MEVCGLLPIELAVGCATVLSGSEALEAVVNELGVLLVEVLVSHHVRCACVHLVTAHLQGPEWWSGELRSGTPGPGSEKLLLVAAGAMGPQATDLPAQGSFCTCKHAARDTEKVYLGTSVENL